MAVDKKFFARSVQKKESLIVAYCAFTNMPFVVCDPETFNDQVFLFDTETQLQEFAKPYTEKKILLKGIRYENKDFLPFFSMLFSIGVNELVFTGAGGRQSLELTELVRQPDYSGLPKEKQPVTNPGLQLTGIYFMQEASRPVPNEEKANLAELEEELSANLLKARYILPIELLEGPESDTEKLKNKKYRLPILRNKNGDLLQPLFTDPVELGKFSKNNRFKALAMPFGHLSRLLVKDSKGYLLNPAGFHLLMPKALLDGLQRRLAVGEESRTGTATWKSAQFCIGKMPLARRSFGASNGKTNFVLPFDAIPYNNPKTPKTFPSILSSSTIMGSIASFSG